MHPPDLLREWLAFLGVSTGAFLGLGGIITLLYRFTLRPRLEAADKRAERIEIAVTAVEFHLVPNQREGEARPEDRDLPLRTLVLRTSRHVREINGNLVEGSRWMQSHDLQHVRQDKDWPVQGSQRT